MSKALTAAMTVLAAQQQLTSDFSQTKLGQLQTTQRRLDTQATTVTTRAAVDVLAQNYTNVVQPACSVKLMDYTFNDSYGTPYSGNFSVPSCGTDLTQAYLRYVATCDAGIQFDRLGGVWVNGVELLRSTTEEPSRTVSPTWQVIKDVSIYTPILRTGGSVVVALDNVITDVYTSKFKVQVYLDFFKPASAAAVAPKPDAIYPVSDSKTTYGWFNTYAQTAGKNYKMVTFPRNTEELYMELFLSHHQCDEFWWSNPPTAFASGLGLCGNGAYREVQVRIDDEVAGVVWPFPLIFTGGINPYLWRPVVAPGAFQAPTYMLNLTPFLNKVVDGAAHNVSFFVSNGIDYWPISGNLLVFKDAKGTQTTATVLEKRIDREITPVVKQSVQGYNGTFNTTATRAFYVKTQVKTSKGTKIYIVDQQLTFSNKQVYYYDGNGQIAVQNTGVTTKSSVFSPANNSWTNVTLVESYPLSAVMDYFTYPNDTDNFKLVTSITHEFSRKTTRVASGNTQGFRFGFDVASVDANQKSYAVFDTKANSSGASTSSVQRATPTACSLRTVAASNDQVTSDTTKTTCAVFTG